MAFQIQEEKSGRSDFSSYQHFLYSKDYIRKTKFIASRIIVLSRTTAWDSYEDIWKWYQNNNHGDGYLRDIRRILGLLANFHIYGLFPNNGEAQNPLCLRASAYSALNQEFKMLVDFGREIEEKRGLKQTTIHKRRSEMGLLLYSLQIAGEDSLSKISEYGVISFFTRTVSTYVDIPHFLTLRRILFYYHEIGSGNTK